MQRSKIIVIGLLIASGIFGHAYWKSNQPADSHQVTAAIASKERDLPSEPAKQGIPAAVSANPHIASGGSEPNSIQSNPFDELAHDSFPYAKLIRLLEARQPGSYAAVKTFVQLCHSAMALSRRSAQVEILPSERAMAEQRSAAMTSTQASQEIVNRCQPILDDARLRQPLSDDRQGMVLAKLVGMPNGGGYGELSRLYMEGAIDAATIASSLMANSRFIVFDGIKFAGLNDLREYLMAVEYATLRATSQNGKTGAHLMGLMACIDGGNCTGSAEDFSYSGLGAEDRMADVRAAGERIANALRNRQMDRFTEAR